MATWVRGHAGLIPWVRDRAGRALPGWHSYGAWAYPPEGVVAEYLLDDRVRLRTDRKDDGDGLAALAGVERIRDLLTEPGKVVRLTGLSGVGKTRLVQALFDDRIGQHSLDPARAIYTNLADSPDPQPIGLASDLIAQGARVVLIIDNCPPDLHRRLSELCRSPESALSLLTIEYDIRDDQQEGTEVFKLEPSSEDLIEKLIAKRFPALSQVDAGTIAKFSGGNARVAMALAATVGKNETIAGLKDEDLFRRLFQQAHQPDDTLLRIAQACALVYSFQGEELAGPSAELPRLGSLVGKSAQDVFAGVAELQRRDLAQKRSVWRAVLPHAVANRLAALALQNIPLPTIQAHIVDGTPERLIKSFSRRLGYLDGSEEAMALVERWLAHDGLLGNIADFDEVRAAMFQNVAPVAPEAALTALERAMQVPGHTQGNTASVGEPFVRLLRSIAYDPQLYPRSMALLVKLAETEDDAREGDATRAIVSMFPIHLSGTHATIEQRLAVIDGLVRSASPKLRSLGLSALERCLDTGPFSSSYDFDFGARSRDHGYWPRTQSDVEHWFDSALKLAETLVSDGPLAPDVRTLLANSCRGLWSAGIGAQIDNVFRRIAHNGSWREGWVAVRQTQLYDAKRMSPEDATRLAELERCLRPQQLPDKVRAIVLSSKAGRLDFDEAVGEDDIHAALQRRKALINDLGQQTATDEAVFRELLPELVTGRGDLTEFGRGLAKAAIDPKETWEALVSAFGASNASKNEQVLRGFLNGLHTRDPATAEIALEEALTHETLAPLLPVLQAAVPIDSQGVRRIKQSLASGKILAEGFRVLAYGGASEPIPASDLRDLLLSIADLDGGLAVACDILYMRLHSDKEKKRAVAPELVSTGATLLSRVPFTIDKDENDDRWEYIARACLTGEQGAETAAAICGNLRAAVAAHETLASYHDDLLEGLFAAQPIAALDGLLGSSEQEHQQAIKVIDHIRRLHSNNNPLCSISNELLLEWCDRAPNMRYPLAGLLINISNQAQNSPATGWSGAALALLDKAPDRVAFLKPLVDRLIRPMSWSGSYAAVLEANAKLLAQLESYPDPAVAEFCKLAQARLMEKAARERRSETKHDREADERFE